MFSVKKRVERVRTALVRALRAKSVEIMQMHATKKPEDIPWLDLSRAMILGDLADIIHKLGVEELPEDKA